LAQRGLALKLKVLEGASFTVTKTVKVLLQLVGAWLVTVRVMVFTPPLPGAQLKE
jgi:hypothetical protein